MARKLRVVAVDDSRLVIRHVTRLLEGIEGVEIVGTATDGARALKVVADSQPDLVLLDVTMPRMSGIDVLRVIQVTHPRVRVAVVSSRTGEKDAAEAFRLGAAHVVAKPYEPEQLAALVEAERAGAGGA